MKSWGGAETQFPPQLLQPSAFIDSLPGFYGLSLAHMPTALAIDIRKNSMAPSRKLL